MEPRQQTEDVAAIKAVIARQFDSVSWAPGIAADWGAFAADFLPGASLYPAARPVAPQSVPAFVARMQGLAESRLSSFHEAVLGSVVHVFGNIAVAMVAARMTEAGAQIKDNVEMLLLVRSEGAWRIAAQAWDRVSEASPLPEELLEGSS